MNTHITCIVPSTLHELYLIFITNKVRLLLSPLCRCINRLLLLSRFSCVWLCETPEILNNLFMVTQITSSSWLPFQTHNQYRHCFFKSFNTDHGASLGAQSAEEPSGLQSMGSQGLDIASKPPPTLTISISWLDFIPTLTQVLGEMGVWWSEMGDTGREGGKEGRMACSLSYCLPSRFIHSYYIARCQARCSVIVVKKNNLLALMRMTVPSIQYLLLSANQMYVNTWKDVGTML